MADNKVEKLNLLEDQETLSLADVSIPNSLMKPNDAINQDKVLTENPSKSRRMSALSDNLLCFVETLATQGMPTQNSLKDLGLSKLNEVVRAITTDNQQQDPNILGSRRHSLLSNEALNSFLNRGEAPNHEKQPISRRPSTLADKLIFAIETLNAKDEKSHSFSGKIRKVVHSLTTEELNLKSNVSRSSRRRSMIGDLESSLSSVLDMKEAVEERSKAKDSRRLSTTTQEELRSITKRLGRCVEGLERYEKLLEISFGPCDQNVILDEGSDRKRHVIEEDDTSEEGDIASDDDAMLLQGYERGSALEPLLETKGRNPCPVNHRDDDLPLQTSSLCSCSFGVVIKMVQISTTLTIVCTNFYTDGISSLIKSLNVQTFTNIVYAITMVSTVSILLIQTCGFKPPTMLVRVLNTISALLFFTAGIANLFQWHLYFKQVTNVYDMFSDVITGNMTSQPQTGLDFMIPVIHVGTSDIRHYMVLAEGALSVINALLYALDAVYGVTKAVAKKLPISRRASRETL